MIKNKIYSMIGFAKKAGKILTGSEVCEKALKSGKVKAIIISSDASKNTAKKFIDMCKYRSIPYRIFGMKDELGKYTGKEEIVVLGLCDKDFSNLILKLIDELENGGEEGGKNKSI